MLVVANPHHEDAGDSGLVIMVAMVMVRRIMLVMLVMVKVTSTLSTLTPQGSVATSKVSWGVMCYNSNC